MKLALIVAVVATAAIGSAQTWRSEYEAGLRAAGGQDWANARAAFQRANSARAGDDSRGTPLPGPITERREWRNGSAYSPVFLAAYSGYQGARVMTDRSARDAQLRTVAEELEAQLARNQAGPLTVFVLGDVYGLLNDNAKRSELRAKSFNPAWREDTEVISPEILAAVGAATGAAVRPPVIRAEDLATQNASNPAKPNPPVKPTKPTTGPGTAPTTPVTNPPTGNPTTTRPPVTTPQGMATTNNTANSNIVPATTVLPAPIPGGVPQLTNKFALIIGNPETKLPDLAVPFAGNDAMTMRENLVNFGGYPVANIEMVVNGTADQIKAGAETLASRLEPGSTVLIFFSGAGSNINGRDFLTGVDTAALDEVSTMLAKEDLFRVFTQREATVFAFFQAHRPLVNGRVFGTELSPIGRVSQAQATTQGQRIYPTVVDGKELGLYVEAFGSALRDLRTNQIPIQEFGWRVFSRVRGGSALNPSGSGLQTPTLPVLNQLAATSKF